MAGTEQNGPTDSEPTTLEDLESGADNSVQESGLVTGVVERVQELLGDDRDDDRDGAGAGPTQAELVDGAELLFVDPAGRSRDLREFSLVMLTAAQYPEPAIVRSLGIEIPDGSMITPAGAGEILQYGDRRLVARPYTLVEPDRVDEVDRDDLEELPEAIVGESVPRKQQEPEFLARVVAALE